MENFEFTNYLSELIFVVNFDGAIVNANKAFENTVAPLHRVGGRGVFVFE